jgi:hypothetical protein
VLTETFIVIWIMHPESKICSILQMGKSCFKKDVIVPGESEMVLIFCSISKNKIVDLLRIYFCWAHFETFKSKNGGRSGGSYLTQHSHGVVPGILCQSN